MPGPHIPAAFTRERAAELGSLVTSAPPSWGVCRCPGGPFLEQASVHDEGGVGQADHRNCGHGAGASRTTNVFTKHFWSAKWQSAKN